MTKIVMFCINESVFICVLVTFFSIVPYFLCIGSCLTKTFAHFEEFTDVLRENSLY